MEDLFKPLESLSLNNVELTGKELGRGAYGVVLEVKVSGLSCAGKKLHDVIAEEYLVKNFVKECVNHSQLRHPNIVQLMGVYFSPDSTIPILVMERLQVSLARYLDEANLPLKLQYDILLDVANGLNYLHNRTPPITHRDLTAQNVLLTKSFKAKISDLGVSKIIDPIKPRSHTIVPGNPVVMPPEAHLPNKIYDLKLLDVFSYGCLILHVFNQDLPVPVNQLPSDPLSEWQKRFAHVTRMGKDHPMLPVAKNCLENDPTKRPSMSSIIRVIQATADISPDDSSIDYLKHTYERILDDIQRQNSGVQVSYSYKNYDYDDFADVTTLNRSSGKDRLSFSCEDIKNAVSSERKDKFISPLRQGKKKIKFDKSFSMETATPGSAPIPRKKLFAKKIPTAAHQDKRPSMFASFTVEEKPPPLPPRVSPYHSLKPPTAAQDKRPSMFASFTVEEKPPPLPPRVSPNHSLKPPTAAQDKRPQSMFASFTVEKKPPPLPPRVSSNHGLKFPQPKSPLISNHRSLDSSCPLPNTHSPCSEVHTPPLPKKITFSPVLSKKSAPQSVGHPVQASLYPFQSLGSPTSIHMHEDPNIDSQFHFDASESLSIDLSMSLENSPSHEWYYHKISNTIAKEILLERERKNGSFIIGSNSAGEYYLSVYFEKTITHIRIYRDTNGYYSLDNMNLYCDKGKSFASLDELVTFYRMNPLVINGKLIELNC